MAGEERNNRRDSRRGTRRRSRQSRDSTRRNEIWREPTRPARRAEAQRVRRPGRRRRRNRRDFGYLYRFLSTLVIFATVLAALIMFFRVKIVKIVGAHRYSDAEILSVADISEGKNMFLFNKYKMEERLVRELTYLEDAHISRDFPDTLIIDLKECVIPLAIPQDEACWLVSAHGKILDRVDAASAGEYAQITGCPVLSPSVGTTIAFPRDRAPQQRSLIQLLIALDEAQMLDDVDGIRLDKPDCLLMDYGGRFTVKFPLDANYHFKLHALDVYISGEKIQENMTGTFDLTRDDRNYFQQNVR